MSTLFSPEELAEMAAADAEIEQTFQMTLEERVASEKRDEAALANVSAAERRRAAGREYYKKNREKLLAYQRAYRAAHAEQVRAYHRAYYAAHREEACAYRAAYEKAHAEQRKEWNRIYRERKKQREMEVDNANNTSA